MLIYLNAHIAFRSSAFCIGKRAGGSRSRGENSRFLYREKPPDQVKIRRKTALAVRGIWTDSPYFPLFRQSISGHPASKANGTGRMRRREFH
ncbi:MULTISPECIES: hypothetical protein [unclassified Sphingomonas]|uniref:hypothetical protein n=1 Tax=unclassified Sphingomonas TaxID=196159 RepID=UPI0035A87FFE